MQIECDRDKRRPEYQREDFGPMVRGKYAGRLRESSNMIVLDPEIADRLHSSLQ